MVGIGRGYESPFVSERLVSAADSHHRRRHGGARRTAAPFVLRSLRFSVC